MNVHSSMVIKTTTRIHNPTGICATDRNNSVYQQILVLAVGSYPRASWGCSLRVTIYEVMTIPGVVKTVPAKQLGEALGMDPGEPKNDLQGYRRTAQRLFREGRDGDWVEYSTAIVVPGESLTSF